MNMKNLIVIFSLLILGIFNSCQRHTVPKPIGYFRISIPDTAYTYTEMQDYPYTFRLSQNAYIVKHPAEGENYWIDIQYPMLNATIHCSYKQVRGNFRTLARDAQEFLYKHTTVASSIPMQEFANAESRVWGLYSELHGNTATPIQFVLTDSIGHFFRGSVYCNCVPNQDSLAPIYDYLKQDVRMIMESMKLQ
jgi:gliding motility-associated lipoprotein GldD